MRINHNIAALNTYSRLTAANAAQGKSLEKLSSGQRINKAGDDAAGLAISEKMRNQIKGLDQASRNAQDGISLIQTAEGALNETHSMLLRMRELTVQANNDTNDGTDRQKIQDEITQLTSEITGIADKTQFNGKELLNGSFGVQVKAGTISLAGLAAAGATVEYSGIANGTTVTFNQAGAGGVSITVGATTQLLAGANGSAVTAGAVWNFDKVGVKISFTAAGDRSALLSGNTLGASGTSATFQIGANADQELVININNMRASALGTATTGIDTINVGDAAQLMTDKLNVIDTAISAVSDQRSKLGAWQNRLEHTINNLSTSSENLTAAESRVRDVDMAKEMMEFTKNNILNQASTAMLAQANQQPQGVLQLLK